MLDLYLDPGNRSSIHGTVYTPHASVSVHMHPSSQFGISSGLISRSLYVYVSGNLKNAVSFASVPYSSQGTDPSAYLTAYVCETAPTCSAGTGVPRVRAKVMLIGQSITVRREARIPSYSVLQ